MGYKEENIEIIKNFIEEDFVEFIQDYFSMKINSNQYDKNTENFTHGYNFYGDTLIETILQNSCEIISELIDVKILPTFSLTTMFMKDDIYKNNQNDSTEITGILFLGYSNNSNEDEFKVKFNNKKELSLSTGDLLIFNSKKLYLQENIITNKWILQASLNFVDSEGNYKDNIYDNRLYLGFPILEDME